jgi:hypothetical protein
MSTEPIGDGGTGQVVLLRTTEPGTEGHPAMFRMGGLL